MDKRIASFLDLLSENQASKIAEAVDEISERLGYEKMAQDLGTTVEQVKSAEVLENLVFEGFFNGLGELTEGGVYEDFIRGTDDD